MTIIKQAMILSAGKGTRMRPLTLSTPKPLIDVAGQPLIVWHILALKSVGITDITINCSWLADKLMTALGDGNQFGVNLHWSLEEGEPLETAGGIAKALHDGKLIDEPFILVNGDVWTTFDFAQLTHAIDIGDDDDDDESMSTLAHLLLIDNPEHNPTGDFILTKGLAKSKSQLGSVSVSQTQSTHQPQTYTFAGISIIHPKLLAEVSPNEAYPLAPLLIKAMAAGQVTAEKITDIWVDVGTPERLAQVNDYIAKELKTGQPRKPRKHRGQV